jgi:hypothetical protein
MKSILFFAASGFILLLAACTSFMDVHHDYDSNADFESYESFAVGSIHLDSTRFNEFDIARINRAIENNLREKGFKRNKENPDIILAVYLDIEHFKKQTGSVGLGVGLGTYGYYGGASAMVGGSVPTYTTGEQGKMVIDIIQKEEMMLVWRGTGEKTLDPSMKNADFDEQDKRLQKVIDYLLEDFPPIKK